MVSVGNVGLFILRECLVLILVKIVTEIVSLVEFYLAVSVPWAKELHNCSGSSGRSGDDGRMTWCDGNSAPYEGEGQFRCAFWSRKHRIEVFDCEYQAVHL
jgi:hypothetical protein